MAIENINLQSEEISQRKNNFKIDCSTQKINVFDNLSNVGDHGDDPIDLNEMEEFEDLHN